MTDLAHDFQQRIGVAAQEFIRAVGLSIHDYLSLSTTSLLQEAFSPGAAIDRKMRPSIAPMDPSRVAPYLSQAAQVSRALSRVSSSAAKRSPSEMDETRKKLLSFIRAHPGLRIEQINRQLGTTTKALSLPIRQLIGSGEVTTQGRVRSTTYHAATGSTSKLKKSPASKLPPPKKPSTPNKTLISKGKSKNPGKSKK